MPNSLSKNDALKRRVHIRWWVDTVPQTLHQTLVPSLRGVAPVTSIFTPHTQITVFSMIDPMWFRLMNSTLKPTGLAMLQNT
jgi:hypothetical protein